MVVQTLPRTGHRIYTAGTDPHPNREQFNERMTLHEALATLSSQGTLEQRPPAGAGRRFFVSTENGQRRLYWDDGGSWVELTTNGGGGAGRSLVINGNGAEGSSSRSARADHTHPLALASASAHGAMSLNDKAKLDASTSAVVGGTLMQRNAEGQSFVAAPELPGHAVNMQYVDDMADELEAARFPERVLVATSSVRAGAAKPASVPWTRYSGFVGTQTGAGGDNPAASFATDGNGFGGFWFGANAGRTRGAVLPVFKGIQSVQLTAQHPIDAFAYEVMVVDVSLTRIKWRAHRMEPSNGAVWANGYGGIDMFLEVLGWV